MDASEWLKPDDLQAWWCWEGEQGPVLVASKIEANEAS